MNTIIEFENQLHILHEIDQAILAARSLDEIAHAALRHIRRLVDCQRAHVVIFEAESPDATIFATDANMPPRFQPGTQIHKEDLGRSELLEQGLIDWVSDITKLSPLPKALEIPKSEGVRSFVRIPFLAHNELIGFLSLGSEDEEAFDSDDLEIASQVADSLAVAFYQNRLSAQIQQQSNELERVKLAASLRAVTDALHSTLKLEGVLDLLLQNLIEVVPYNSASVMLMKGERFHVITTRGHPDRESALEINLCEACDPLLAGITRSRAPLVISDTRTDRRYQGYAGTGYARSWLGVPLISRDGNVIGVMTIDHHKPSVYSDYDAEIAFTFAGYAMTAIENATLFEKVNQLAITDELTGLYNRRYLFELGEREFNRARRFHRPLSVIMLDIDHFKHFNDNFGHATGDDVLREVAARTLRNIRDIDLVGRYGGEEFLIFLPETGLDAAISVARRVHQSITHTPVETLRGQREITISLGVIELSEEITGLVSLVDHADAAMYQAKRAGRNRVVSAPENAASRLPATKLPQSNPGGMNR